MLFFQAGYRVHELVCLLYDDLRQVGSSGRGRGDFIHHQAHTGGINKIQNVIQRRCKPIDVLTVERRNEGLIELGKHVVGHLVATVLDVFELLDAAVNVLKIIEDFLEQTRAFGEIADHLGEDVKKPGVLRNQADHE